MTHKFNLRSEMMAEEAEAAALRTCPRCHGEGVTYAPHIVGSAWSHTMTACDCPAGREFEAAVTAQQGKQK